MVQLGKVVIAVLILAALTPATRQSGVCRRVAPTNDQTASGTCASSGYDTKCCHYGRFDECKASDGDCYCHADCVNDEECCEDVHCCSGK